MNLSDEYPLARGYRAASRLDLQHYIWKQSQGYLVHPNIPLDPEDLKIADIGTGTGIWLLDLADQLPVSVQLDGFDIDTSQCPPAEWLPENVAIHKLDIYGEIPRRFYGQYDIIHVRFFLCVVIQSNPKALLERLMVMLKPSGWIQWTEQDVKTCRIVSAKPNAKTEHTKASMDFAMSPTPSWPVETQYWVADLPKTFQDMGLADVKEERCNKTSWTHSSSQDVTMLAMEEISMRIPNGPSIRQMISRASQEFEENERGIAIVADKITVIGRKI
ncbi:hypothetical protein MMC27_000379 [Xylographa pallens]|nr:hypothetical protein [Xylographa pallens]